MRLFFILIHWDAVDALFVCSDLAQPGLAGSEIMLSTMLTNE